MKHYIDFTRIIKYFINVEERNHRTRLYYHWTNMWPLMKLLRTVSVVVEDFHSLPQSISYYASCYSSIMQIARGKRGGEMIQCEWMIFTKSSWPFLSNILRMLLVPSNRNELLPQVLYCHGREKQQFISFSSIRKSLLFFLLNQKTQTMFKTSMLVAKKKYVERLCSST